MTYLMFELLLMSNSVWGERLEAYDVGDEASRWISHFLNKHRTAHSDQSTRTTFSLVYHRPELPYRRCDEGPTHWHQTAKPADKVDKPSCLIVSLSPSP